MVVKISNLFKIILTGLLIFAFLTIFIGNDSVKATDQDINMREKILKTKKSVVQIRCSDLSSLGTGFIVRSDGIIATNFHVVGKIEKDQTGRIHPRYSSDIKVLMNGEEINATLLITSNDPRPIIFDYALLKIDRKNLDAFPMNDFEGIHEGDSVYFMGFPFGKPYLTTHRGMISSKHETVSNVTLNGRNTTYKVLQIDGSVNKGNSGGPLINMNDEVVGIISMREGSISSGLEEVREFILQQQRNGTGGGVFLGGVNPIPVLFELINVLDTYISPGIGFAIAIEYLKEHLEAIR